MKKQIVIVTRRMITGGVERALIAMLKQFDYNEGDVDLYVELEDGEYLRIYKFIFCQQFTEKMQWYIHIQL